MKNYTILFLVILMLVTKFTVKEFLINIPCLLNKKKNHVTYKTFSRFSKHFSLSFYVWKNECASSSVNWWRIFSLKINLFTQKSIFRLRYNNNNKFLHTCMNSIITWYYFISRLDAQRATNIKPNIRTTKKYLYNFIPFSSHVREKKTKEQMLDIIQTI